MCITMRTCAMLNYELAQTLPQRQTVCKFVVRGKTINFASMRLERILYG